MASLLKFRKIPSQIRANNCVYMYNVVRNSVNRDYAPGPYPVTEEEKVKAAKKYGLRRDEYEPFPDDGNGHGDYPNVPLIGAEAKDPYYPYDYPEFKRNFDEPMPIAFNTITEDRWNPTERLRFPMWIMVSSFVGAMSGFFFLAWLGEKYKMVQPQTKKQFPKPGVTHYTFEPLK